MPVNIHKLEESQALQAQAQVLMSKYNTENNNKK